MNKLGLTILLFLIPTLVYGAATERSFTLEYTEPTMSRCAPSTQLKPVSSPTMCVEGLGSETRQQTCNVTKNQIFEMVPVSPAGSGLFQLKSRITSNCLRMGSSNDDPIIETGCANASTGGGGAQDQIFRIGTSPSPIQSNVGAGGLCFDVDNNSTSSGVKIRSFQCHSGANQSFAYNLSPGNDCPLDDLAGTKIYMDVIFDGVAGTVDTINATAKTGGGKITKDYCVPILDDTTADRIEIQVTAFDESGNESPKTPTVIHPVPGTRDCQPVDVTPPATPVGIAIIP